MIRRCIFNAVYLEPPPGSKSKIGPRAVQCIGEGFPEKCDWYVCMLPYHTIITKNTPDKMLARCYELYPEWSARERRMCSLDTLADTLAGIQVYYAHVNWAPMYAQEKNDPSMFAKGFDPSFEIEVSDEPAPTAPEKRIILG